MVVSGGQGDGSQVEVGLNDEQQCALAKYCVLGWD